ncbi:MAG TPA: hypothetical protein VFW11_24420 [Cyclobacteriaceae bacterium]|nr:hypothetical protein [Cyclobacteriaceae bacterium]
MEKYYLKDDLRVFGVQVKTFPIGIGEAFDSLIGKLPEGLERSYYGISYVRDKDIVYLAVTAERFEGEAEKYNYERFTIAKGNYNTIMVKDWSKKTDKIKDVFHEIMKDDCPDENRPCVEWYKSDKEMLCMVRVP